MGSSKGKIHIHKIGVLILCFLLIFSSFLPWSPSVMKAKAETTGGPEFLQFIGDNGTLQSPYGIAKNSKGEIYVSEIYNGRIVKFNQNGEFSKGISTIGCPSGLAIDSEDHIYVADSCSNMIMKFDSSDHQIAQWGASGEPWGLAIDANNNIYVAEMYNQQIQKFTSNGNLLKTFNTGSSSSPAGVAVDSEGHIFVSDISNNRIQKFSPTGTLIKQWGSTGVQNGQFQAPYGLAADSSNNIYVGDFGNSRVQVFNSDGEFKTVWNNTGSGPLFNPIQVAFNGTKIYVAEYSIGRVSVFGVQGLMTPEKSKNADLSNVTLNAATLQPVFSAPTTDYTAFVGNAVENIQVTPTAADSHATITVNGQVVNSGTVSQPIHLDVGSNPITIIVTAEDGTTKTYTVTVNKAQSSNGNLSNLTASTGTLNPVFNESIKNYSIRVPNLTDSISFTPVAADSNATVNVVGSPVISGQQTAPIHLNKGDNTIPVEVTAQDGTTTTYTIVVKRNNPPVTSNSSFSVNENASQGTLVGRVPSTDIDGDGLNYRIISGNDTGAFEINQSGDITVADERLLDYENIHSYELTIQVSDQTDSVTSKVTIQVNDVNDHNPIPAGFNVFMNENTPNGTTVGTVTASDGDAGSRLSYSITAGNEAGAFIINSNTGEITVADSSKLDFETVKNYTLTVQVSDGTHTADTTAGVYLINVNDNSPVMNNAVFHVDENAVFGTWIGRVIGSDADGDQLNYSIISGNELGAFTINSMTGDIIVADSSKLDYETKTSYELKVKASDEQNTLASPYSLLRALISNNTATDIATITIHINDLNDNHPVPQGFTKSLDENTANGSLVGTVNATDADADSHFTYSITSGNEAGAFTIDPSSGAVTVVDSSKLDYETVQSFNLTVQVSDATNTTDTTVTINLNNLNDNSPVAGSALFFQTNENTANGTMVGIVTANDADNDQLSFRIVSGNEENAFAIDSATGKITVADQSKLDYETVQGFTFTVQASDGAHTAETSITVNLTNLNDNIPALNDEIFTIDENSTNGATAGIVRGTDADGDQLHYSIVTGNNAGAFAMDASTGKITVADSSQLDYEKVQSFTLKVQVSDGTHEATSDVKINLTNLNDNPPVSADADFTIDEKSANGLSIGTITASDADGDAALYSIASGNDKGIFVVNEATGEITLAKASLLDAAAKAVHTLTIYVNDGKYTAVQTVTVHILSSDTTLSQLTSSKGNLDPAFKPETTRYSMMVGESVKTINLTPATANANATVKINGKQVTSGQASDDIALNAGKNTIAIEVTAQNGQKAVYTVTVTRLQKVVPAVTAKNGITGTVSDDQVNLVDDNGALVVELKQNLDEINTIKFTGEQLETLINRHAVINILKNDVQLSIPAANFAKGEDLTFSLEKLDKNPAQLPSSNLAVSAVYDFTIKRGDQIISQFDHEIELAYPTDGVDHPEELKVYYWNTGKKAWELVGGVYENGMIKAMTNHFSTYAVFHPNDLAVKKKESDLPNTSTNMYNWLFAGILFILLGGALFMVQRLRQRNN